MKSNELIQNIELLGLSALESQVYVSVLSTGETTPLIIARTTQIKRPTVYTALERLRKMGLVSYIHHGFKKYLVATNPERIVEILHERNQKIEYTLPYLTQMYGAHNDGLSIQQFDGLESILGVYRDLLTVVPMDSDYYVIGNQSLWYSLNPKFFESFMEKRAKLNLHIRLLIQDGPVSRKHKQFERNYNQEMKILTNNFNISTNTVITQNQIVIHQLVTPQFALVIKNRSIIDFQKQVFEMLWNSQ